MSGKSNSIFKYGNYVQDFYYNKFNHHREALSKQLEELKINHDSLQPPPPRQLLIEKMNDWKYYKRQNTRQTEKEYKNTNGYIHDIDIKLNALQNQLQQSLVGLSKNYIKLFYTITQLNSTPSVNKIHTIMLSRQSYSLIYHNLTANGYGLDNILPLIILYHSLYKRPTISADSFNHRIVTYECDSHIVAGGNGEGNTRLRLSCATHLIVDRNNYSLILCNNKNKQMKYWLHINNIIRRPIIILNHTSNTKSSEEQSWRIQIIIVYDNG